MVPIYILFWQQYGDRPPLHAGSTCRARFQKRTATSLSIFVSPGLTKKRIANLISIPNIPPGKGGIMYIRLPLRTSMSHVLSDDGVAGVSTSLAILFLARRLASCITSLSLHTNWCVLGTALTMAWGQAVRSPIVTAHDVPF